jgi:peptidyl-prolyl cis-trans isomerase SurA
MMRPTKIVALLAFIGATPAAAQERTEFLGRIVAVIGDSIVTNVDLQEAMLGWQATTGQPLPQDPVALAQIQREVLEDRIDQLLLLQEAQRDTSLRVPEAQVTQTVDQNIRRLEQQLGGPAAFERALQESNLTRQSYRERMLAADQTRDADRTLRSAGAAATETSDGDRRGDPGVLRCEP